ncbi:MAG: ribonuclease HII [Aerococcus sp.]|nr:ribonuclease HII [Aerococcus sp.]
MTAIENMSLNALKDWVAQLPLPISETVIKQLQSDRRAGAHRLAQQLIRKNQRWHNDQVFIENLQSTEKHLHQEGYRYIAGTDEVGRGPLAGPVVVSAVMFPETMPKFYVNDSKQLSHANRQAIVSEIEANALAISVQVIDNETIDRINILEASRLGMTRAVKDLTPEPDYIITDAVKLPDIHSPQANPFKGDATVYSVAAASIYAKEYRDRLMCEYAKHYPEYHFDQNFGYPTKAHLQAIERYGITPIHRRTFAPIKNIIEANKR